MSHITDLSTSLSEIQFCDLDDKRQELVRKHLLDTVGAAMAGAQTPEGRKLLSFYDGGDSANAVSARCAATRLTEIDDIDVRSCTTPGSIVVPTALTLAAEGQDVTFGRTASALCAGYAAMVHLGRMVDGAVVLYRGIWPTLFCAPIAAAAVAARLRNLDPDAFTNALALAMGMSGGRPGRGQPGPSGRWLLAGEAARLGVIAARAAEAGFVGDPEILDGPWLERAHGIETRPTGSLVQLRQCSFFSELSLKPYCSAKQLMAALLAFEHLLADNLRVESVESVQIAVPPRYSAMLGYGMIEGDRLSGIASAPYTLALAAFEPERLSDVGRKDIALPDAARAFMDKVSVTADEALEQHLPSAWPARVTVRTTSATLTKEIVVARGDPDDPLDYLAVTEKFARVTGRQDEATQWAELIQNAAASDRVQPLCARFGSIFKASGGPA
ncbi:MAG: MmgE/PrpD family protein [Bauldia litoralis]